MEAVGIEDIDQYPLLKLLKPEMLASLGPKDRKLLSIDWTSSQSIFTVIGGDRAQKRKLIPPPLQVYCASDDYGKNYSNISQWFRLSAKDQNIQFATHKDDHVHIEEYNHCVDNMKAMMTHQREKLVELGVLQADIECATASIVSCTTTNKRRRTISLEPVENTLVLEDTDDEEEDDVDNRNGHGGLFCDDVEMPLHLKTKKSAPTHIANASVMKKIGAMMRKVLKFFVDTKQSDNIMDECNDCFLVHVNNVDLTSTTGGGQDKHFVARSDFRITVVARSSKHFVKMYRNLCKAMCNPLGCKSEYETHKLDFIGLDRMTAESIDETVNTHISNMRS